MMAKPIRALELHYPMIQFLIQRDVHQARIHTGFHRFTEIGQIFLKQIYFWWIKNFPICKALSKTGQYPIWVTRNTEKGDFRELKSKTFTGGACP